MLRHDNGQACSIYLGYSTSQSDNQGCVIGLSRYHFNLVRLHEKLSEQKLCDVDISVIEGTVRKFHKFQNKTGEVRTDMKSVDNASVGHKRKQPPYLSPLKYVSKNHSLPGYDVV
jgi:hypothetical protein